MKKLHALFLLLFTSLFAIHNGNPSEPNMPELGAFISCDEWWGFKLGYEWDYTFDKRVKIRDRKSSVRKRFDHYILTSNKAALTFDIQIQCFKSE